MDQPAAKNTLTQAISLIDQLPRPAIIAVTFAILLVVAVVDYLTGYEISCTVFYLLAIGIAAWFIGPRFGIFVSLLSAAFTSYASVLTGQIYSNHFAPFWNAAIVLSFYLIVVWLLRSLRLTQDTLERRVRERTAILTAELAERKRLENEILVISEREQRRIGLDIHDSLCQHLTGTALAEQFLVEKLSARDAPEVEDADRVVGLIEDAISMARSLAAGLSPSRPKARASSPPSPTSPPISPPSSRSPAASPSMSPSSFTIPPSPPTSTASSRKPSRMPSAMAGRAISASTSAKPAPFSPSPSSTTAPASPIAFQLVREWACVI